MIFGSTLLKLLRFTVHSSWSLSIRFLALRKEKYMQIVQYNVFGIYITITVFSKSHH